MYQGRAKRVTPWLLSNKAMHAYNGNVRFLASPLTVKQGQCLTVYTINTNGMNPVRLPDGSTISKIKALDEQTRNLKADVALIGETKGALPNSCLDGYSKWETHACPLKDPNRPRHGTGIRTRLPVIDWETKTNCTMGKILLGSEEIWHLSVYFSNHVAEVAETILDLKSLLAGHKGERIIMGGDFNSTETLTSADRGGSQSPTLGNASRGRVIYDFLDKAGFRDLWTEQGREDREKDKKNLNHLTHWNHEYSRGSRLDRIYANFEIAGRVEVTTHFHPHSDHKGVLLRITSESVTPNKIGDKTAPHKAYGMDSIRRELSQLIRRETDEVLSSKQDRVFERWDKLKAKIADKASSLWEEHLKTRGRKVMKLTKQVVRICARVINLVTASPLRDRLLIKLHLKKAKLDKNLAYKQASREDRIRTNSVKTTGKVNAEFLAIPRGPSAKIANMTICDLKDQPAEERTDDMDIISNNFTKFYSKLYETKHIDKQALHSLLDSLDLEINQEERDTLEMPIAPSDIMEVMAKLPAKKAHGMDRLPYEALTIEPRAIAEMLAKVSEATYSLGSVPKSWKEVVISVLPKEKDSYSTHKFRPISLLATDYKVVARIWANRLGPILARILGDHQKGFIPGRDGRENVLTAQLIIDHVNANMDEGAAIFLDQEKAFDRVSFEAIHIVFEAKDWPERFKAFITSIYAKDSAVGRVRINGVVSAHSFNINSGTRQGCPLSPLIYAIIADLFNSAVIKDNNFTGIVIEGIRTAITAYADDTVVYLGNQEDIAIFKRYLKQYNDATGGLTNLAKSKAIQMGAWQYKSIKNLGVATARSVSYLGIPTGHRGKEYQAKMEDILEKIQRRVKYWDFRLNTSPIDRVLVAKVMVASVVWYHASLMHGWDTYLKRIEDILFKFVWRDKIPKVARKTMYLPREEGGLNFWNLEAKGAAFQNVWVVKYLNDKLPPSLKAAMDGIVNTYNNKFPRAGNMPHPFATRLDISESLKTVSPLMAQLQVNFARVIRRDPSLVEGTYFLYLEEGANNQEQFLRGYGIASDSNWVEQVEAGSKAQTFINGIWFQWNIDQYVSDEVDWVCPVNRCHIIPSVIEGTRACRSIDNPKDLYVKTRNGNFALDFKSIAEVSEVGLDTPPIKTKSYNKNSVLYQAHQYRTTKTGMKPNVWSNQTDVPTLHVEHKESYASSQIKGFMWLFLQHALPVRNRSRASGPTNVTCKACPMTETIEHAVGGCPSARENLNMSIVELWTRMGCDQEMDIEDFGLIELILFQSGTKVAATVKAITMYHSWKHRNKLEYEDIPAPPKEERVNAIWAEVETSLLARLETLDTKIKWWRHRQNLGVIGSTTLEESISRIQKEFDEISPFIMNKSLPSKWRRAEAQYTVPGITDDLQGGVNNLVEPQLHRWRLYSVPEPTGISEVYTSSTTQEEDLD